MDNDNQEIEELQQILREDSSNFQVRRRLAMALLDKGFNEESLKQFQFLITIFPNDASLYYNMGIVYEKMRKLDMAEQTYLKGIELAPDDTDFYYNLGLVYIDMYEFDKAIEQFKIVLETDSDDGNSFFNLGLCYIKKKPPQFDIAKICFLKAVNCNSHDIFAHFHLGYIYKMEGKIKEAIAEYQKETSSI